MAKIPVWGGGRGAGVIVAYATVDDDDVAKVEGFRWCKSSYGYAMACRPKMAQRGPGRFVQMHRLIMGLEIGQEADVDHINHDLLDNRKSNLRVGTRSQNLQNMRLRPQNKSGHPGIWWDQHRRKWLAQAKAEGKYVISKRFNTREEAIAALTQAREKFCPFSPEATLLQQSGGK